MRILHGKNYKYKQIDLVKEGRRVENNLKSVPRVVRMLWIGRRIRLRPGPSSVKFRTVLSHLLKRAVLTYKVRWSMTVQLPRRLFGVEGFENFSNLQKN